MKVLPREFVKQLDKTMDRSKACVVVMALIPELTVKGKQMAASIIRAKMMVFVIQDPAEKRSVRV